jgi:ornithine cyclodeaminase/alanine dehydrogenase
MEAVNQALREKALGRVQMPPKHWLTSGDRRFFSAMTSVLPAVGATACKWQSGSPDNQRHGLPFITGLLILNDLETGAPLAIMDSTWLTAQRTAAATAVAARCLSTKSPLVVAILGCGVQARTNFEMLQLAFPGLATIQAYDIVPQAMQRYAEEMRARHGARVRQCKAPREAVEGADIVVTCGPITSNPDRVGEIGWLKPGALAVTLDYDCYWKPEALRAADAVFTDDIPQLEHLREYGYFNGLTDITGEIGDAISAKIRGRTSDSERIFSINMGIALEDVSVASRIYSAALTQKRGIWLPW